MKEVDEGIRSVKHTLPTYSQAGLPRYFVLTIIIIN